MAAATAYFLISSTNPSNRNYMKPRYSSYNMSIEEEKAAYRKRQATDNISETSSFISMDKFISRQAMSSPSKRQAISSKLQEWRTESYATWKKVQPYYENFKYWVMMGPH